MNSINFKRDIQGTVDHAVERVTKALGEEGFGILTRIDMHTKIKEKTGKDIVPTVILGACNPNLALRPTPPTPMSPASCHAMRSSAK